MTYLGIINWLVIFVFIFLSGITIILFVNLRWFKRFDQFPRPDHWPNVSILVPARNEEGNIEACVLSLISQDYPSFEVFILDDESTDNTITILKRIAAQNRRLNIINGKPLPPGWKGKNWACQQLAEVSKGELILFTDADTVHHPQTLKEAVSASVSQDADLLTCLPFEIVKTWGEKLLIPYIFFSVITFLPIILAQKLKSPTLCFAIGQFMLFKRKAFLEIGGYEKIKNTTMEDLTLGRRIKSLGMKWRMADGSRRVQCRMYHGFSDSWNGLSRFLYLGYENNLLQLLIIWLWTSLAFLGPFIALVIRLAKGSINYPPLLLILFAIFLNLAIWGVAYRRLHFPIYLSFLFPITFVLNFLATLYSMYLILTGRTTWKGRSLN